MSDWNIRLTAARAKALLEAVHALIEEYGEDAEDDDDAETFYRLIKPLPGLPWSAAAERVHRLPRQRVEVEGLDPDVAMVDFADWVDGLADGRQPVFVGWNAGFDWMFVADYLERFVGRNPFGYAPLDIKAYIMGLHQLPRWADTRRTELNGRYGAAEPLTHHALDDARQQARFIRQVLSERA